jgi:hypothetical protein
VISYDGLLCFGFNADYDRVPDLDAFVAGVNRSFAELAEALGVRSCGPICVTAPTPAAREPEGEPVVRRASAREAREISAATH